MYQLPSMNGAMVLWPEPLPSGEMVPVGWNGGIVTVGVSRPHCPFDCLTWPRGQSVTTWRRVSSHIQFTTAVSGQHA